jgi:hypothetical protein
MVVLTTTHFPLHTVEYNCTAIEVRQRATVDGPLDV